MESKGRHQSADWCKQVSGGHLFSPWEIPCTFGRIPEECGRMCIMFSALLQNIEKAHRPPRLHCPITKGKATLSEVTPKS